MMFFVAAAAAALNVLRGSLSAVKDMWMLLCPTQLTQALKNRQCTLSEGPGHVAQQIAHAAEAEHLDCCCEAWKA